MKKPSEEKGDGSRAQGKKWTFARSGQSLSRVMGQGHDSTGASASEASKFGDGR